MATVHEVRLRHESHLLALPGVVGVADTVVNDRPVINVFVVEGFDGSRSDIPSHLDGIPVEIIPAGEIDAQQ